MHKVLGKNSGLPGSSYDVSVHGVSMNDVGVSGITPSNAHKPTCTIVLNFKGKK